MRFHGEAQLLTAGADPQRPRMGRAIIWDLISRQRQATLQRARPIHSADINHDNTMLITVEGEEHFARLWSLPGLKELDTVGDHSDIVRQATFSPDGKSVLTASNDQSARIYRLNGERLAEISTNSKVRFARFSKDARLILTCKDSLGGAAQLWRVADGAELVHFDGHRDKLSWGTFNDAGTWAATAARDGTTCYLADRSHCRCQTYIITSAGLSIREVTKAIFTPIHHGTSLKASVESHPWLGCRECSCAGSRESTALVGCSRQRYGKPVMDVRHGIP